MQPQLSHPDPDQLRALVQSFVGRGVSFPSTEPLRAGRPRKWTEEERRLSRREYMKRQREANLAKGLTTEGKERKRKAA